MLLNNSTDLKPVWSFSSSNSKVFHIFNKISSVFSINFSFLIELLSILSPSSNPPTSFSVFNNQFQEFRRIPTKTSSKIPSPPFHNELLFDLYQPLTHRLFLYFFFVDAKNFFDLGRLTMINFFMFQAFFFLFDFLFLLYRFGMVGGRKTRNFNQ